MNGHLTVTIMFLLIEQMKTTFQKDTEKTDKKEKVTGRKMALQKARRSETVNYGITAGQLLLSSSRKPERHHEFSYSQLLGELGKTGFGMHGMKNKCLCNSTMEKDLRIRKDHCVSFTLL